MGVATTTTCEKLQAKLLDASLPLPFRFRVLFALRGVPGVDAVSALASGLGDPSALLRHEVAFALGQKQDAAAIETLAALLADATEHPMVRHEAAEALGAIGGDACLAALRLHVADEAQEVRETCQLALQRVERKACAAEATDAGEAGSAGSRKEQFAAGVTAAVADGGAAPADEGASPYLSVDPVPAAPSSTPAEALRAAVLDESADMFERYAAMFALRNRGGGEAAPVLAAALKASDSALLKHEIAYVLGQLQHQHPEALEALKETLLNQRENPMVRHECAEALGSIAAPETIELLKKHCQDPDPVVAESCAVALDIMRFEMEDCSEDYCEVLGKDE
mmetsp:Transcript_16778/g.54868  ORF Transcript_16778/g.54868 Transcript_16778/m.54868 type:complete len:339 (+) Transcript_16778:42-1058(+)|eukprot:CAMPEP_0170145172 /NCGR_PEP_ID=MMETSP0033_2-20121228/16375_1 /TAXON_ID=195969 /ORGANISM="Dolichomastix tenuilepis, Strain CCMP3274" /LENGTH=338 /DNA_ID=CAMNT_0010381711 /DNA_START=26 /DNA_END=1042 /DNA_ORIENTATION=-